MGECFSARGYNIKFKLFKYVLVKVLSIRWIGGQPYKGVVVKAFETKDGERFVPVDELLVTKTDPGGVITYANNMFVSISGYTERELIGAPHKIIRHPDMPRCIFRTLWDTIQSGKEIFAFVKNRAKNGDYYWVYAHVTPGLGVDGTIAGYHSSRRAPDKELLEKHVIPLYEELKAIEDSAASTAEGIDAALKTLQARVDDQGFKDYDQFIHSLGDIEEQALELF